MADALLRHKLAGAWPNRSVPSGFGGHGRLPRGGTSDPRTVQTLQTHGVKPVGRARQVAPTDFEAFDHVLAMDRSNLRNLTRQCPPHLAERLALALEPTTRGRRARSLLRGRRRIRARLPAAGRSAGRLDRPLDVATRAQVLAGVDGPVRRLSGGDVSAVYQVGDRVVKLLPQGPRGLLEAEGPGAWLARAGAPTPHIHHHGPDALVLGLRAPGRTPVDRGCEGLGDASWEARRALRNAGSGVSGTVSI